MNFFFGFKHKKFNTSLTIPKFQNRKKKISNYKLYQYYIDENKWKISEVIDSSYDDFYLINQDKTSNEKVYFLADEQQINKGSKNKLINYNNFTDTTPEYRSNLQVSIKNGGFSSYQSDYPFTMTNKNGSIMSSCSSVSNIDADENYIIFKNIFHLPIREKFNIFFINIVSKKVLKSEVVYTNFSNILSLDKELINPNVYLFSDRFIGIPMFLSIKNNHLSFEHTHPPHSFIMGKNQFKIIAKVKNELRKIIN